MLMWCMLGVANANAQTSADLDAARLRAEIAEQNKKEAEANAAVVKAQADAANVAASSKAALTKAEADAAKATSDYYQSIVPDPDKYKIADPKAPKLNASAARLAFWDASALARDVGAEARTAARKGLSLDATCATPQITVLVSDPKVRALLAASTATRQSLAQAADQVDRRRVALEEMLQEKLSIFITELSGTILGLSTLGELAASFAKILKSQYAFESLNQTPAAEAVFKAAVASAMLEDTCLQMLDAESVLALTGTPGGQIPAELAALARLEASMEKARAAIKTANARAEALRGEAGKIKTDKDKEAAETKAGLLQQAGDIETAAKALGVLLDEREKAVAALYAADAQGNTALDAAIRGGLLLDRLNTSVARVLSLKLVGSDVDVYAKDGLFRSLSVGMGSHTAVTWQVTDAGGRVLATGARNTATPLTAVRLPD